jgi:hypothetical protein
MRSPNGYTATMNAVKQRDDRMVCGSRPARNGNEVLEWGTVTEACFFDGYWNCNLYPGCNLCDRQGANSCRAPAVAGRFLNIAANSTEANSPEPEDGGKVSIA